MSLFLISYFLHRLYRIQNYFYGNNGKNIYFFHFLGIKFEANKCMVNQYDDVV